MPRSGSLAALLVLAQAVLIAHVAARSFDGAGPRALSVPLAALCIVVTPRAAAAWGFDVVGRLAAADVLSALRGDLVRSRLSDTPAGLDAQDDAELAVAAVAGIDALETVFARLLPQLVLAAVVPAARAGAGGRDRPAVGPADAAHAAPGAGLHVADRPHHRAPALARWQELSLLSSHFLDVVRGLPTLRAFNRGEAQAERIDQVGERYRRATMETLRLAFLSGAVLDLAATLGVALIAVTVGVRLVEGDIGFEAAVTVLLLAPELYLPLRNLASQFHAGADGMAVAGRLLDAATPPAGTRVGAVADPGRGHRPLRRGQLPLSAGRPGGARAGRARAGAGRDGSRWSAPAAAARARSRACCCAWPSPATGGSWPAAPTSPPATPTSGGEGSRGCRSIRRCCTARSPTTSGWAPRTPRTSFVRDAAETAGAAEFISELPAGYETTVGDGGRPLSAGETQRIALARALLRDAPLLILDEPTANLDPASAELVRAAVDRCRQGRTVLVIAHDDELASRADRIVRLQAAAS
jgi:ABC-type transport system involved in cytochrome bd biosynthesis fused ATPase/permease subunit